MIREKHYLDQPLNEKSLMSLAGTELDPQLRSFSKDAREKRARYYVYMSYEAERVRRRMAVPFKETPVFVTPDERKQYEADSKRTIEELKIMIHEHIAKISDSDVRESFEDSYGELDNATGVKRMDYLNFLQLIKEYIENVCTF